MQENLNQPNQQKLKAIVCPRCKSKEIAIITEYHKANWARCLQLFFILVTIILLVSSFGTEDFIKMGLLGGFAIIAVQAYIAHVESKTHIQCICRICGRHWLHDE